MEYHIRVWLVHLGTFFLPLSFFLMVFFISLCYENMKFIPCDALDIIVNLISAGYCLYECELII